MASLTTPTSFIEIFSENLQDGFYKANVTDVVTGAQVKQQEILVEGNTSRIYVETEPTKALYVSIYDNNIPTLYAELAYAETIGELEFFANETFRVFEGYFDYTKAVTINGSSSRITTHEVPVEGTSNTAKVTFTDNGRIIISPDGSFDHLDSGEFGNLRVAYTTEEPYLGVDLWDSGTDDANGSNWTKNGRIYTPVQTNGEFKWISPIQLEEGSSLVLNVETNQTSGSVDLNWIYNNDSIGSVFSQYNLTTTGQYNRYSYPVPANVKGIRFRSNSTFNGTVTINSLSYEYPAEVKYLDFIVKSSEEVSSKLIETNAFYGDSWGRVGSEYTPVINNTDDLVGNLFAEDGKIYEVALTVSGRSSGDVYPTLVGDTEYTPSYWLSNNDREVWYLQAPTNTTSLHIKRSADFNGKVKNIYVRELFCEGVDNARELDVRSEESGKLILNPLVAPIAGRRSDIEEPEFNFSGEPSFSTEFGVRINSTSSYVIEDAFIEAKRSGVSTKGGDWAECWNVTVLGGYTGNNDKYQTGIQTSDNSPWMENSYIYNCYIDLYLPPMPDNYVTQNSDCYLYNSNHAVATRRVTANMLNCIGKNASDGIVDNKVIVFANHCDFDGGHRTVRGHSISQTLVASSILNEQDDSQAALHMANVGERINIWNSYVNGYRVLSSSQLQADIKPSGRKYAGIPALFGDIQTTETRRNCSVLKTFPRMPTTVRPAITHWEWEISPAGTGEWSGLIKSDLFEAGSFRREVEVDSGSYDLRFRTHNANNTSDWLVKENITVL